MTRPPEPSFLEKNLRLLAVHQPDLAGNLEARPPAADLEVVPSRSGPPVPVKRNISLHSRMDPEKEAAAWADSDEVRAAAQAPAVLVFGFGFGYHLEKLLDRAAEIAVFEPDPGVPRAACERVDLSRLIPRIRIFLKLEQIPGRLRSPAALLVHRPTGRLEPVALARLERFLQGHPVPEPFNRTSRKILVVPPLSGGSLPIARHAARALNDLGHRVVEPDWDRPDPNDPAGESDKNPEQIAARAETLVVETALSERPDLILALAQAPLTPKGLGRPRRAGIPAALWFVEDFRHFPYFRTVAPSYDYFFHIQGPAMEKELAALGPRHFHYLPLAADPALFRPLPPADVPDACRCDLSFMGAGYPNRREVFRTLLDYDLKIWGDGWDLDSPLGARVQNNGRRVSTEETVPIFNGARVNLNLHSSPSRPGLDPDGEFLNPRAFEIAACGAFQLVDRRRLADTHFRIGEELAVYDDPDDLRRQIDFYLARPDLRAEMGRRARARVLAEHTYAHRMRELVDFVAAHP